MFNVTYPDGTFFTPDDLGEIRVRVGNSTHWIANLTYPADITYEGGNWTASWKIPKDANTTLTYNFTICESDVKDKYNNSNTDKAESGTFKVTVAPLTVEDIYTDATTYYKESYVTVYFEAFYPELPEKSYEVTTGTATVTLIDPDGVEHNVTATYNSATGRFEAKYWLSDTAATGNWTAKLSANSLNDGNDNIGPAADITKTFEVKAEVTNKDIYTWLTETLWPKIGDIKDEIQGIVSTLGEGGTFYNFVNDWFIKIEGYVDTVESSLSRATCQ